MMDLFLTNTPLFNSLTLDDGFELCGLLVLFLSAVWTLILTAPIHCTGYTGDKRLSKLVLMKKQIHLGLGWSAGE